MFKEYLRQYRQTITENNPANGICYDGAVDLEVYTSKQLHLLFLLKETNGNNNNGTPNTELHDWDYMEWVRAQAVQKEPLYRSVYRNIAMWARMFEMFASGHTPKMTELIDKNGLIVNSELCTALAGIALINLKKSWGKAQTDWQQMKNYLDGDVTRKEILCHQIDVMKPNLVLCGGTFDFAYDIFGKQAPIQTLVCNDGQKIDYFVSKGIAFVSCWHPSKPGWSRKSSFKHAYSIFSHFFNREIK